MTTPHEQLREAAERFDVFFRRNENESRDLDESQIPTDKDYLLAANVLRALADLASAREELLNLEARYLARRESLREERDEALSRLADAYGEIEALRAQVARGNERSGE